MTHGHPHCSDCINLLCNGTLWERGIEWKIKMGRENQIFILSFLIFFPIKSRHSPKTPSHHTPKQYGPHVCVPKHAFYLVKSSCGFPNAGGELDI